MKFDKYKNANITIEIQSMIPERFINLLWKNGVKVKNVVKTSVTTFVLDIDLKDYAVMENIARRTGTKVKISKKKRNLFSYFIFKKKVLIGNRYIYFFFYNIFYVYIYMGYRYNIN